jgi:hypothetical protein
MKGNSPNLIKVFLLKEKAFWKRTLTMKKKMSWLGFIIGTSFIAVAHYAFAFMHFLFECLLWAVMRPQFRANMVKMQAQVA